MLEEVQKLLDTGLTPEQLIYYGLEYKFLTLHLIGELTFDEMFRQLEIAIHQFAKRQMTWFRGMEKRGPKFIGLMDICRWKRRWRRFWNFWEPDFPKSGANTGVGLRKVQQRNLKYGIRNKE
ncbi:hypothetical protein MASR2M47_40870 [Draconibacterium sp.]